MHTPVLLEEVLAGLAVRRGGIYVDCTFGRGGHSRKLLECAGSEGWVFAMDKDPEAASAGEEMAGNHPRFVVEKASYTRLADLARTKWKTFGEPIFGRVDGVLFDLGVSSPQLTDPERGFGFMADGPLDMRMDPSAGISAAKWLEGAPGEEITEVLKVYGEERHARRIARAIVEERRGSPIRTTGRLAALVARASPSRERNKHPATRAFQAIRIHINRELDELRDALGQVQGVLAPGGRFAVISFHSLEDRLVKRFIRAQSRETVPARGLPIMQDTAPPPLIAVQKRPVRPSAGEVAGNPRARSALLRIAQKRPQEPRRVKDEFEDKRLTMLFRIFMSVLALTILASSVGVVYVKHLNRSLFMDLQRLEQERDAMDVDWGRLAIEQSTWATHDRVEKIAREQLRLKAPDLNAVVLIMP